MKWSFAPSSSRLIGMARILMLAWMIINIVYLAISLPAYYQRRAQSGAGGVRRHCLQRLDHSANP